MAIVVELAAKLSLSRNSMVTSGRTFDGEQRQSKRDFEVNLSTDRWVQYSLSLRGRTPDNLRLF